jgi:excisionase family DNA binding protein
MSKKYLSLEETAQALGVSRDELIRMREKGQIRGFADRGTWKFREEDVLQVRRSRQADSDPEVPLLVEDDSAIMGGDEVAEEPTIITKGGDPLSTSDSEVKLMGSVSLDVPEDSDSDVKLVGDLDDVISAGKESLSDVKPLLDDDFPMSPGMGSESDVRIVSLGDMDSDSDVALVSESSGELNLGPLDDKLGSDSDVRLVADAPAKKGSDSDVKLLKPGKNQRTSDSDVALLRDDDDAIALDFTPSDDAGASVLSDESGLAISGDDSALLLRSESGISLEGPSDSGVGMKAAGDESITLDIAGDSGISLETGDSGISLESVADSGISLEDSGGFAGTVPMMKVTPADEDETAFEIPALKDDDSAFELSAKGGGSDQETAVFDLAGAEENLDDAVFDLDEEGAAEGGEDATDFEDDLEVAEDVLGEDDELDELDVFDADDDAFDEGSSTGGQKFASPVGAVAVEHDWGAGTFVGLLISTAMLAVVGIVMFDLIHNMWAFQQPTAASSTLLDSLGGLYK